MLHSMIFFGYLYVVDSIVVLCGFCGSDSLHSILFTSFLPQPHFPPQGSSQPSLAVLVVSGSPS